MTSLLKQLNIVFGVQLPLKPKGSLLNVLEEVIEDEHPRIALGRVLFLARRLLLIMCNSPDPPTQKSRVASVGKALLLENDIYTLQEGLAYLKSCGEGGWIPLALAQRNLYTRECWCVWLDHNSQKIVLDLDNYMQSSHTWGVMEAYMHCISISVDRQCTCIWFCIYKTTVVGCVSECNWVMDYFIVGL